ncbi:hypothetical protein [Pontibacter cellulosilyticus]|uniref:Uncharacterized protein n=1 Tax=Pontibacter cellulosilyticus TaxID=1720253 RepID=A0A923N3M7_9BACT|nr:hypothetical protein [Pontibacter cellulosilyticus]MBC5991564.1 hypothetical protein [Pontibacter cellulosilyticus]
MRQTLLTLLFSILSISAIQAQDIITKRTGEKVEAKVMEITTSEIKYKNFNNLEGPLYVLPKAEVLLIQYENKTNEVFELPERPAYATASVDAQPYIGDATTVSKESALHFYTRGQADATTFYEGYKPASTTVLVVSLISPVVGLIPAVGATVSKPKTRNLQAPRSELLQQPDYHNGYQKEASKIKIGKVWQNWGIAFGANLLAVLLIASGQ